MQSNNTKTTNYIEEDEIDLRELFRTIWDSKILIISITLIITLLAGIYAFTKTPIFEAKALIEMGNYKLANNNNNNNNNKVLLNNPSDLAQKLNIIFIDTFKNVKDRQSEVTSITMPKKSKLFLEISAEGISNELATKEIENVLKHIRIKDNVILLDVKNRREVKIKNIEAKIKNIQEKEVTLINDKINLNIQRAKSYHKQLSEIEKNILKVQNKHPTLAALLIIQKVSVTDAIALVNEDILDLKNKEDSLLSDQINLLIEEKNTIESMLLPYNYKNSQIIGKILTNNYASKPKKKLIVVVAFITGFILSIFLVFFLSFIQSMKEEELK